MHSQHKLCRTRETQGKELNRINDMISGDNVGLAMCAIGLAEVFLNSQTERRRNSIRYFQEGRLRAIVDTYKGIPHGDFLVFYPDRKLWMRGVYRNGDMIGEAMRIFMPNGTLAKESPPPNNVIPFKRKNRPL
ncbi:MAG: hypothetical protein IPK68_05720 [Bdellovibrionales bacterium]|nr:hypothetical protein [Bdellovibrionales bacterium]